MRTNVSISPSRLDRNRTNRGVRIKRSGKLKEFVKTINRELKEMENLILTSQKEISTTSEDRNL
jgi:hypothetical protein